MGDYVVIYEPENGKVEVFGIFKSESNAREWMRQDAELMISEVLEDSEIREDGDSVVIDGYVRWTLKEVAPALENL